MNVTFRDRTNQFVSLQSAYNWIIPLVWYNGTRMIDERGNNVRELQNVQFQITGKNIWPIEVNSNYRFAKDFADGLTLDGEAELKGKSFVYAYGERIRRSEGL
jgi:hypothetical protein